MQGRDRRDRGLDHPNQRHRYNTLWFYSRPSRDNVSICSPFINWRVRPYMWVNGYKILIKPLANGSTKKPILQRVDIRYSNSVVHVCNPSPIIGLNPETLLLYREDIYDVQRYGAFRFMTHEITHFPSRPRIPFRNVSSWLDILNGMMRWTQGSSLIWISPYFTNSTLDLPSLSFEMSINHQDITETRTGAVATRMMSSIMRKFFSVMDPFCTKPPRTTSGLASSKMRTLRE